VTKAELFPNRAYCVFPLSEPKLPPAAPLMLIIRNKKFTIVRLYFILLVSRF
jgi:hypothetical protein